MNEIKLTRSAEDKMNLFRNTQEKIYLKILGVMEKLAMADRLNNSELISSKNIKVVKGQSVVNSNGETLYSYRISMSLRMLFTFSSEDHSINILDFVDYSQEKIFF